MKRLFVTLLFFCILTSAFSQTEYQWDEYGVGFSVTDDFSVTTNNSEEFTAISSDGLIEVQIYPNQDGSVTQDDVDDLLLEYAIELLDDADALEADDIEIDDYYGSFLIGASGEDMILVAFLLDEGSDTNLIVQILFEAGNEDEAAEILGSFYAY